MIGVHLLTSLPLLGLLVAPAKHVLERQADPSTTRDVASAMSLVQTFQPLRMFGSYAEPVHVDECEPAAAAQLRPRSATEFAPRAA